MTFRTNWTHNQKFAGGVKLFFYGAIIVLYFTFMMENFLVPTLEAYNLVTEEIIGKEDSFLMRTVDSDVQSVVDGQLKILEDRGFDSMSEDQQVDEIHTMLGNVTDIQEELLLKLLGIILTTMVLPLVGMVAVLWYGYKLVSWATLKALNAMKLVPNNPPPFELYFKDIQIVGKKKKGISISKKFEEIEDDHVVKCSCLDHDHIHSDCHECLCRNMS